MQLLDEVSKNNRGWYTRDAKVGDLGYTFELSAEQRKRKEERDQDMAHMRTEKDLLTKHIVPKSEKVNVMGHQNMYEAQDINFDEEANYLGNQGGFQNYNSGNQGYNSGNACRNYIRDGQYDRSANRERGNWQNRYGYINYRSSVYVHPGNRDRACGSSSESKLEDKMAKIEQQLGKLSASLNQRKNGSLPSDTIQNPKKDGHCMAITTRSGKVLTDPISAGTKDEQILEQAGREEDEAEQVDDLEDLQPKAQPVRGKDKEVEENMPLKQIPKPPPHFPQTLKKKAEDGKFTKFITILKQLSVSIPPVEALEQMPGYAKFMKDLVTKKRVVSLNFINDVHHCSAIATRTLVQKKEDPGAFTKPCTIQSIKFAKPLCDLGASINLMSLAIYKKLGLGFQDPQQ
ncbi:uncharacterized protein [Solanum tuberosum]|uniref:uncharacterized protein n=1 Tax=Solanum tuberosum TaxID=4113 RepID=UPI000739F982|nr:PREDICTED: uncharacterized protein LOC107059145 [Solanum tuberosum]